jgi:hypothetical protein
MKISKMSTLILAVILTSSISSNAQFIYGFKTGVNFSAQAELGNLNDGNNFKPGFMVGAMAGTKLNKVFTISTELLYQNKGGKSSMMVDDTRSTVERTSNYLTVPVLLSAGFSEQLGLKPEWSVYGTFGPYYGWLLNTKDYVNGTDVTDKTGIENSAADTDWGLVYGMGVCHSYEKFTLFSEIRYDMGLSEVVSYNDHLRNKTISLTVGINL